ncbi:MAG: hypothetical protein Q9193_002547, partial [Seirophora villosa]
LATRCDVVEEFEVVEDETDEFAVEVALDTLIAFWVGFGTPRGFWLPLNVDELIPLIDAQPSVSQYRPTQSVLGSDPG